MPFSTSLDRFSSFFTVFTHSTASIIFLPPRNSSHSTSSFTALAFAPGVLNTTIPFSAYAATGMLFVPAPALATASRFAPVS